MTSPPSGRLGDGLSDGSGADAVAVTGRDVLLEWSLELRKQIPTQTAPLMTKTITSTTTAMTAGRGSPVLRFVLVAGAGASAGGGFVGAFAARAGAVVRRARAAWTAGSGEVRSQSTRSG